jgi:hypothetical protein
LGRFAAVLVVACLAVACVASPATEVVVDRRAFPSSADEIPSAACAALDPIVARRIYNGIDPVRSGEIQLIPPENLQAGGLSHASPFDTTQRVPLLIHGPGVVPGTYDAPATLADLAPTAARILRFPGFRAPDGRPLMQALQPDSQRPVPRLVVTVIWDSAGLDLLNRWPDGWPRLRKLAAHSAWFTNAAVGATPSNTPPSHATIGTGAFPMTHGIPDEYVRYEGRMERPLALGPKVLRVPTLADRFDRALGNRPKVGMVGSLSAHLLMMSRGSFVPGADRDLAVTREPNSTATGGDDTAPRWRLPGGMSSYYSLPEYVNEPALAEGFRRRIDELDRADGQADGRWRDHEISSLLGGWETPARSAWQTDLVEAMIEREGFGVDEVPDLLYVNYKMLDSLGHKYSADGVELLDGLRAQDQELDRLVRVLDEQVGRGEWVMFLTADHGMARDPALTGAERYEARQLARSIEAAFGSPDDRVVDQTRPTQIWLDLDALARSGSTVEDVALHLWSLTRSEVVVGDDEIDRPDEPAFLAVVPTAMFPELPCLTDQGS